MPVVSSALAPPATAKCDLLIDFSDSPASPAPVKISVSPETENGGVISSLDLETRNGGVVQTPVPHRNKPHRRKRRQRRRKLKGDSIQQSAIISQQSRPIFSQAVASAKSPPHAIDRPMPHFQPGRAAAKLIQRFRLVNGRQLRRVSSIECANFRLISHDPDRIINRFSNARISEADASTIVWIVRLSTADAATEFRISATDYFSSDVMRL